LESIDTENIPASLFVCRECGDAMAVQSKFCTHCGAIQQDVVEVIPEHTFQRHAKILSIFYLVYLITCLITANVDAFKDYGNLVWMEIFLAVWTLIFAYENRYELAPLYSIRKVRLPILFICAIGAIVFSLIVSTSINWLNFEIYGKRLSYYGIYENLEHSVPIFFMSVAVYPAIFEELGFRGVIYNYVDAVAGPVNAIFISSMAFAIIHVSIISLIWLVPFALIAGYLRRHYNTLWYGIILHLFFNGTVCVTELMKGNIL
jgi:membrane protease YdiL (CAAX protease family)